MDANSDNNQTSVLRKDFPLLFQWFMSENASSLTPSGLQVFRSLLKESVRANSLIFNIHLGTLAKESALSVNTVRKGIQELKDAGVLRSLGRQKREAPITYELTPSPCPPPTVPSASTMSSPSSSVEPTPQTYESLKEIIRALLFVAGRPVSLKKLVEITERSPHELTAAIEEFSEECQHQSIRVSETALGLTMETRPEYAHYVSQLGREKRRHKMSLSEYEVLAIILYKGPISRRGIGLIRGKEPLGTIGSLLKKGLIDEVYLEHEDVALYVSTPQCLHLFGLKDKSQLPPIENVKKGDFSLQPISSPIEPDQ